MRECVEDRSEFEGLLSPYLWEFEGLLSPYLWYENVRETVKL